MLCQETEGGHRMQFTAPMSCLSHRLLRISISYVHCLCVPLCCALFVWGENVFVRALAQQQIGVVCDT